MTSNPPLQYINVSMYSICSPIVICLSSKMFSADVISDRHSKLLFIGFLLSLVWR